MKKLVIIPQQLAQDTINFISQQPIAGALGLFQAWVNSEYVKIVDESNIIFKNNDESGEESPTNTQKKSKTKGS